MGGESVKTRSRGGRGRAGVSLAVCSFSHLRPFHRRLDRLQDAAQPRLIPAQHGIHFRGEAGGGGEGGAEVAGPVGRHDIVKRARGGAGHRVSGPPNARDGIADAWAK